MPRSANSSCWTMELQRILNLNLPCIQEQTPHKQHQDFLHFTNSNFSRPTQQITSKSTSIHFTNPNLSGLKVTTVPISPVVPPSAAIICVPTLLILFPIPSFCPNPSSRGLLETWDESSVMRAECDIFGYFMPALRIFYAQIALVLLGEKDRPLGRWAA